MLGFNENSKEVLEKKFSLKPSPFTNTFHRFLINLRTCSCLKRENWRKSATIILQERKVSSSDTVTFDFFSFFLSHQIHTQNYV